VISRRSLLRGASFLSALPALAAARVTPAQPSSDANMENLVPNPAAPKPAGNRTPVQTPNGRSLPYRLVNGVKEFHLTAEEIDHEFAPGCTAKCWGYNGSTPGPTIEAVEGDRVRILVSNHLREPTTIHWHGLLLPNGMDGVSGLNQAPIKPGETWAYEFTLRQAGTHMYHPHADELVQMAFGMMGLFIIHPKASADEPAIDRDYAMLLHNWALHPGTYRPDPAVMLDFDLWTFNSKIYPATAPLLARTGERVRLRIGNLSMWNHPIHLHGHRFWVTGSDGDRWPRSAWIPEVTHIIGVGQTRDFEFIADNPGDWALHCHMVHHSVPNPVGAKLAEADAKIRSVLPGNMSMGSDGMSEMADMAGMMQGPPNTVPMMSGNGSFGSIEMGGMFTVLKVRDDLAADDTRDPGWYRHPPGTQAKLVSFDPQFALGFARDKPSDS
jgi:FtsP/CotA-like multicopper oxidase with cupredoxin domain